ncbi:MAG: hypothetical protein QGI33_02060 [Candidatus Brocadiia bacterium]|nr:hypothetical protein [Candidatus Brocadiia bacterium]
MSKIAIPNDRMYLRNHEWIMPEEGSSLLGVAEPVVKALGSLISVEIPGFNDEMMQGIAFGAIEGTRGLHELNAPADAVVLEVNDTILWDLEALSSDPYGKGWLLRIRVHDREQLQGLLDAATYRAHCSELRKKGRKLV